MREGNVSLFHEGPFRLQLDRMGRVNKVRFSCVMLSSVCDVCMFRSGDVTSIEAVYEYNAMYIYICCSYYARVMYVLGCPMFGFLCCAVSVCRNNYNVF